MTSSLLKSICFFQRKTGRRKQEKFIIIYYILFGTTRSKWFSIPSHKSARLRARSISVAYLSHGIHVSPFLYTDVHTYIFIGRKVRILENNLLSHTLICSRRNNNNNNNEIERVLVYLYKEEGEEEGKEEEEDI